MDVVGVMILISSYEQEVEKPFSYRHTPVAGQKYENIIVQ